ncbi:MAG TPA: hypothetical protein VF614_15850 [Chthoniobacteraceae bacterium]|jgi:hypothetical protein
MSIHAPDAVPAKPGSPVFAFMFLTALAVGFLGAGWVLGTEQRLVLERSETGSFRVTGSNHFAGTQFFSKTIEGVTKSVVDDAVRDDRRDSAKINRKRRRDFHVVFAGANRTELSWGRKNDSLLIDEFMRGTEPSLALSDVPPLWKRGAAWLLLGLGTLTFVGAIQSFFPKKGSTAPLRG